MRLIIVKAEKITSHGVKWEFFIVILLNLWIFQNDYPNLHVSGGKKCERSYVNNISRRIWLAYLSWRFRKLSAFSPIIDSFHIFQPFFFFFSTEWVHPFCWQQGVKLGCFPFSWGVILEYCNSYQAVVIGELCSVATVCIGILFHISFLKLMLLFQVFSLVNFFSWLSVVFALFGISISTH